MDHASAKRKFDRILIVQFAFPGDVVLTVPVLHAVKELFPESRLDFLGTPQGCAIVSGISGLDIHTISYDKKNVHHGISEFFHIVKKLRKTRYHLIVCAHKSLRTSLLMLLSHCGTTIGFRESALPFVYSRTVHRDPTVHEIHRNLSLLTPLGYDAQNNRIHLDLGIHSQESDNAEQLMRDNGYKGKPAVSIAAGSVWATKMWPTEYYIELIDRISEQYAAEIILLGSPNEIKLTAAIEAKAIPPVINLAGKTDIRMLGAVIRECSVLISNDSAPLHFASAVRTPVIAFFGPTVQSFGFTPFNTPGLIIENTELDCRPCSSHGPAQCPKGHFQCMRSLSPSIIREKTEAFLDSILERRKN